MARYILDPTLQSVYLEDLYTYLIKRKYFTLVRQLMDTKVPTLYDDVLSPPNAISETLLHMIQHPLKLLRPLDPTSNTELANLIVSSFIQEILVPPYSTSIQWFLIPCLANNTDFPFLYLIQFLGKLVSNEEDIIESGNVETASASTIPMDKSHLNYSSLLQIFDSSYLLNALLKLDSIHFDQMKQNKQLLCYYIRILARMSCNIRKLPRSSATVTYRLREDDGDIDDYDSDDSSTGGDWSGTKNDTISRHEHDILIEAITHLNEQRRAILIVNNYGSYLEVNEILHSLCRICHNLMLYHRNAIFEYK